MICLQETKCFEVSKESCFLLWGCNNIDWVENNTFNNVEGVITLWKRNNFQLYLLSI